MARDTSIHLNLSPAERLDLSGKRVAIIGGTGGIGQAFARRLARQGAHVTVVGRSFRDEGQPGINFVPADLSRMAEAERVARALPAETLDALIFTAGIMAGPERKVTPDGIEQDLAISYLNRFVMQREMAPRLGRDRADQTIKPRIFNVAFPGSGQVFNLDDPNAERKYARMVSHSSTVAGNEVLVLEGARENPGVNIYGLNPGFVRTGIRANLFGPKWLGRVVEWLGAFVTTSAESYAARVVPLLFAPEIEGKSGAMFSKAAAPILPSPRSTERGYAAAVTRSSETLAARAGVGA